MRDAILPVYASISSDFGITTRSTQVGREDLSMAVGVVVGPVGTAGHPTAPRSEPGVRNLRTGLPRTGRSQSAMAVRPTAESGVAAGGGTTVWRAGWPSR